MIAGIKIDNLKCGGCASTIQKGLTSINGVKTVHVEVEEEIVQVEFENEVTLSQIKTKLKSMGYPEKGTVEGFEKLTAGAKSYVSCAIGRFSDKEKGPEAEPR